MNAPFRKATNISLDAALVSQARDLGINISRACEQGLATEITQERAKRWRAENADAINAANAFVEDKGLPLADHRLF